MKKSTTEPVVLIDISAWIEFLRSRSATSTRVMDAVQRYLELDQARLCGVVQAELLLGIKTPKELERLELLFETVPLLETLDADWIAAGHLARQLRSRGTTVPLTDALIAAVATRCKARILTLDQHFFHLEVQLA
jgi:predicted nucleic acid-binding protein